MVVMVGTPHRWSINPPDRNEGATIQLTANTPIVSVWFAATSNDGWCVKEVKMNGEYAKGMRHNPTIEWTTIEERMKDYQQSRTVWIDQDHKYKGYSGATAMTGHTSYRFDAAVPALNVTLEFMTCNRDDAGSSDIDIYTSEELSFEMPACVLILPTHITDCASPIVAFV